MISNADCTKHMTMKTEFIIARKNFLPQSHKGNFPDFIWGLLASNHIYPWLFRDVS